MSFAKAQPYSFNQESVVVVTSNNTIQEVERIHAERPSASALFVICEKAHKPRYEKLVHYFYPHAQVTTATFTADVWEADNFSPWQGCTLKWRFMNMCAYILMCTFGVRWYVKHFKNRTHVG